MPKTQKDPIDAIRVYLPKNGGISFNRSEGAAVRGRAGVPRPPYQGEGFAVYVFDNLQRFRGFLDAMDQLSSDDDRLTRAWATDLPGKLCGIATRSRGDDLQRWVDLRSKGGRK